MIGTIKEYGGQRYECVAVVPYIRRDKGRTEIAVWESSCAHCGEPFLFRSPVHKVTFAPSRRCPDHRFPGRKVTNQELAEAERKVAERKAKERCKAEEARLAEKQRLEEARRKAEEVRLAEERRRAEEARLAKEARLKEEWHKAEEERLAREAAQKRNTTLEEWRMMQHKAQTADEVFAIDDVVWHVRLGFGRIVDIDGAQVTVTFEDMESRTGPFRKLDLFLPPYVHEQVKHDKFGVGTVVKVGGHSDVVVNFVDGPRSVSSVYLKPMY
jgi:hypothetical protein